jgi:hypothetical protein
MSALNGFSMLFSLMMFLGNIFQAAELPRVDTPLAGSIIQGRVNIEGSTDVIDFQSVEISFRYEEDPTDTWYLIMQGQEKVKNGRLGFWDTSTIADGVYRLKVEVFQTDNHTTEVIIRNLNVRNYSPVEPNSPENKKGVSILPTPSQLIPTLVVKSTPEVLPPNPAQISSSNFSSTLLKGTMVSGLLFGLVAIYMSLIGFKRR